jgi:ornithine cyclodeaminase/alanine dehydrogenase-like protein (mu-crystallin family)
MKPGDHLDHSSEIEVALRSADIIICATSSTSPLFPSSWVRDGTHVILIGSYTPTMQEVDKTLILRALSGESSPTTDLDESTPIPILLVDSKEACSHEAGELINAAIKPERVTEIGEMVPTDEHGNLSMEAYLQLLSVKRARRATKERFNGPVTIFKSVGVGLQDVAIATAIVDKALSLGDKIGTSINGYDS